MRAPHTCPHKWGAGDAQDERWVDEARLLLVAGWRGGGCYSRGYSRVGEGRIAAYAEAAFFVAGEDETRRGAARHQVVARLVLPQTGWLAARAHAKHRP